MKKSVYSAAMINVPSANIQKAQISFAASFPSNSLRTKKTVAATERKKIAPSQLPIPFVSVWYARYKAGREGSEETTRSAIDLLE